MLGLEKFLNASGNPLSTIFNAAAQFRKLESLPQQLQDSTFLRELNADGMTVPGITYTVIATQFDNRVFPWTNTFINEPGVKNIVIQDVCPLDHSAHTDIPRTR
ncbi:triacylglycerol lipase [Cutibacterium acnes subsp. defendens ATCC 11828]|nr:triacylglycerol lipase [Cutibacterium acnes subsp. defendens ATCC 11828]